MNLVPCPVCDNVFNELEINEHIDMCLTVDKTYTECDQSKCQKLAIKYCKKKSKIHEDQARGTVLINFIQLGFTEEDLDKVINYIKNDIKVTINVGQNTIANFLINEDHYKSGFELNIFEKNSQRDNWEKNLFHSIYDDCQPIERVKYGALNMFNKKDGVESCKGYGECIFVLKDELKNRISFVKGDSCTMMFHICTFKYCTALLVHLSDDYLKSLVAHVNNNVIDKPKHKVFHYIEAQIHGSIRLNMDIEKLLVPSKIMNDRAIENKLTMFCEKNNIILEII